MGSYIANSKKQQEEMLDAMGMAAMEELYRPIPDEVKIEGPLDIPDGISEMEVRKKISSIAEKNKVFKSIFRGGGAYNHYIPAIVKQVTSKEEFVTAYTPYQAEISQGILQSIFEYQTMICQLTGMDVSNASVYDGATAAAEAVLMSSSRKRKNVIVSETVNPQTIETIRTYLTGRENEIIIVPAKDGKTDIETLKEKVNEKTACVLIQHPNYYGQLEDADEIGDIVSKTKANYIISSNPIALGVIKSPGEYGADIAVGEGQPLGLPLSFGGPYLGFMATTKKLMRSLPGRIVGQTTDSKGERAFVLTLQAREQHIRRERATSNICSNQALCAMVATVYLGAMGKKGLEKVASLSMSKAHYLAEEICKIDGYELVYKGDFFHEFVTTCRRDVDKVMKHLEANGILGGYPLAGENEGHILWCATEMNTKEEIDRLVELLKEVDSI